MKRIKVGINGFGRIGRAFTRIALERGNFELAAVNTRKTPPEMLAYLLKHDSVYRTWTKEVKAEENALVIDGKKIAATLAADPAAIPWENYGVQLVIDATGAFKTREDLSKHLHGGVKKVVITAPAKDDIVHVVLGVNDGLVDWQKETIISNASCTTNCASPLFKILEDNFKIVSGFLTTAHAYTLTQSLLDDAGKDVERSRAAGLNIIPSTTGAAKAVVKTLSQLAGKIDGMALRVPVPTVSFTDISAVVSRSVTVDEVNNAFLAASNTTMKGILGYSREILVSSDFIGSPFSAVFDANYTKVIGGNLVKVFGWYDNEWGYSTRLVDLVEKISNYI